MESNRLKTGDIYKLERDFYFIIGTSGAIEPLSFVDSVKVKRRGEPILHIGCLKYKIDKYKDVSEIFEKAKYFEIDSDFIKNNMTYVTTCQIVDKIAILKRQMIEEIPICLMDLERTSSEVYSKYLRYVETVLAELREIQIGTCFYNTNTQYDYIYAGLNKYGYLTFYDKEFCLGSCSYEHFKKVYVNKNFRMPLNQKDRKRTVDEFLELMRLSF